MTKPPCWWVITGAPGSGKTTLVDELARRGYRTLPEIARRLIDVALAAGATLEEIRGDEQQFHRVVAHTKIDRDLAEPRDELIVFDRGLPDTVAFGRCYDFPAPPGIVEALAEPLYAGALLLDPLPPATDYARPPIEDTAFGARLHTLLADAYAEAGVPVYQVAAAPHAVRTEIALAILLASQSPPSRPASPR